MIVVKNTVRITKGEAHRLTDRFQQTGLIDSFPGFIDLDVLVNRKESDTEEVIISTRWETFEDFSRWLGSDEFREKHKHGKKQPEFIQSSTITTYDVAVSRKSIVQKENVS